eukprot:gene12455-6206_t
MNECLIFTLFIILVAVVYRKDMENMIKANEQIVSLNVGGKVILTTKETLQKSDKLISYIEKQPKIDNSYILDRNFDSFSYIITYLRSGTITLHEIMDNQGDLYYDIKTLDKNLFQGLKIGENMTPSAHSYLILRFDFFGLDTTSFEAFEEDLNDKLNDVMREFKKDYKEELKDSFEINENNAVSTFQRLKASVLRNGQKLYILVDEYDSSLNSVLGNKSMVSKLRIELVSSKFKQIFSRFKESTNDPNVKIFITGVTPLVLSEFTSGFNIARDIGLMEEFSNLYGFTKEVIEGLKKQTPKLSDSIIEKIMKIWENNDNGYKFTLNQNVLLYNPNKIMFGLSEIQMKLKRIPDLLKNNDDIILKDLLTYFEDSNTKPAESILHLISKHPLTNKITTDLLNNNNKVLCEKGLFTRFNLYELENISQNDSGFISYLYFNGALTFSENQNNIEFPSLFFSIPNLTAKREFIDSMLMIKQWKESDLKTIRNSILKMVIDKDITEYCNIVDEYSLSKLKGNDVIHHKESNLVQCFIDAISYSFANPNGIEKEYKIETNFGRSIDLIFDKYPNIKIGMEFKNIPILELKKWINDENVSRDWENNFIIRIFILFT